MTEPIQVRFARRIEEHPYTRLLAVIGIFTALIAFGLDFTDRLEERNDRQEERIARAWQILGTKAPGNSGKGDALETLFHYDQKLSGLNLSCEAISGAWESPNNCEGGIYLRDLNLYESLSKEQERISKRCKNPNCRPNAFVSSNLDGADLKGANVQKLSISKTSLNSAILRDVNFSSTKLEFVEMRYSDLSRANFSKAFVTDSDLSEANLGEANFSSAYISSSSFKRSRLVRAKFVDTDFGDVNFHNAMLAVTDFERAKFTNYSVNSGDNTGRFYRADISGANFEDTEGLLPTDFDGAFSSKEVPPRGLTEEILAQITMCPGNLLMRTTQEYRQDKEGMNFLNKNCEVFKIDLDSGAQVPLD